MQCSAGDCPCSCCSLAALTAGRASQTARISLFILHLSLPSTHTAIMQRSAKAQAQAQAQRQEAIQPAQSIALCQALLRVSIYHVGK